MSGREYRVRLSPAHSVMRAFAELPAAVAYWASARTVEPRAWIEVIETRRLAGHEELTDAGAASLAARVARMAADNVRPETLEIGATPRLGEYKPEVFAQVWGRKKSAE